MNATALPQIEPLAREQRLYERVAEKMQELIREGVWQPGDRIPTERDLARAFNVSRTVVREAVKVLEARGVLETSTGRGCFVRSADSSIVSRSLQTYLQLVDQSDVALKLIEVRQVLETEIAALAARRATQEQIQRLMEISQQMRRHADAPSTLAKLDLQLHMALAQATQNDLFEVLLSPLMEQLQGYYFSVWEQYGERPLEKVFAQHDALIQAVKDGDAEAARRAMRVHLDYSCDVLIEELQSPHNAD